MTAGDIVTTREDPLANGRMIVLEDKGGGWLLCESVHIRDPLGGYRRDVIHEDELQLDRDPDPEPA